MPIFAVFRKKKNTTKSEQGLTLSKRTLALHCLPLICCNLFTVSFIYVAAHDFETLTMFVYGECVIRNASTRNLYDRFTLYHLYGLSRDLYYDFTLYQLYQLFTSYFSFFLCQLSQNIFLTHTIQPCCVVCVCC